MTLTTEGHDGQLSVGLGAAVEQGRVRLLPPEDRHEQGGSLADQLAGHHPPVAALVPQGRESAARAEDFVNSQF